MTSFSSVQYTCIAFRLLRRGSMKLHALLGHPVSENFVSWCQTLKNSSASFLCIKEHLFHILWFKNVYIWSAFVYDVWTTVNWSRILSGKPSNTFSMARLNTFQFHLTLTPLFTATHTSFFFSLSPFFSWSVIGLFGLFSCDPRFMALIYWFTVICEILKNGKY